MPHKALNASRQFVVLNTALFPCPGTHLLHVRKLALGFQDLAFRIRELNDDSEVSSERLGLGDFVYVSNHGLGQNLTPRQLDALEKIKKSGAVPIFWYWVDHLEALVGIFGERFILTGERFLSRHVRPTHKQARDIFETCPNFVPTHFAAGVSPIDRGLLELSRPKLLGYVGAPYNQGLAVTLKLQLGSRMAIRYSPPLPFVVGDERLKFFVECDFSLGWHSEANRKNGVVGERVYEAMALGSIVLTDNPFALQATDGHVVFADSTKTISEAIRELKDAPADLFRMRKAAWEWVQKYGTYKSTASLFEEFARAL